MRYVAAGFLAVFLLGSCTSSLLNQKGKVVLWTPRPDQALKDLASHTPGLELTEAPRSRPWPQLLAAGGGPDLIVTEMGTDLTDAQKAGLLADWSMFLPTLKSPRLLPPSLARGTAAFTKVFLPSSVYVWGLFYNPAVLARAGVAVPQDWASLISAFRTLKTRGVTPIALGSSFAWPALAWISAVDLRMNGAEAHRQLIEGRRPFDDPSVAEVFTTLAAWKNWGWFDPRSSTKNWPEALADVAAGHAGFTLLGSFGLTRITDPANLAFLPLPGDPSRAGDRGELVSVQGFVLSAHASAPEAAVTLADAYVAAGAPGQAEESFRSAAVPSGTGSAFQKWQDGWLAQASLAAPLLDRALAPESAKKADQIAVQFFSPSSHLTVEELTLAFSSLHP